MLYDLRTFGDSGGLSEEALLARQKEEAQRDLRNMEVELKGILERERKKHGLLIKQARAYYII